MRRNMNQHVKHRRRRSAFTLMEVLLVLAILVILGGMVTLMYQNVQLNANKRAARAQIDLFQGAVRLYYLSAQRYPDKYEDLITNPGMDETTWGGPYLEKWNNDPWGNEYIYQPQQGGKPVIFSSGPDGQSNTADDITG